MEDNKSYKSYKITSDADEDNEDSDNYYKTIAKKLKSDKKDLKDKLRALVDKNKENLNSYEKHLGIRKKYYESKIDEISKEKSSLYEAINSLKSDFEKEKNLIKREYDTKISKIKDTVEKKSQKEISSLKEYDERIASLHTLLSEKEAEKEAELASMKEIFQKKEEYIELYLKDLEKLLKDAGSMIIKERDEKTQELLILDKKHSESLALNKNEYISIIEKYKQDIHKLVSENETLKNTVKEETNKCKEECKNEIINIKKELIANVLKMENKLQSLENNYSIRLTDAHNQSEIKIKDIEHKQYVLLEEKANEYQMNIISLKNVHSIEVQTLKTSIEKLIREMDVINEHFCTEVEKKEKKAQEEAQEAIEFVRKEYKDRIIEQDTNNIKLQRLYDKLTGESIEIQKNLSEQIRQYRDNIKKLQESIQTISTQSINNINSQRELAMKEITNRDVIIEKQEKTIKKITEDSMERIGNVEVKNRNTQTEYDRVKADNVLLKQSLEEAKKERDNIKKEMEKDKDSVKLAMQKLVEISAERERYAKKEVEYQTSIKEKNEDIQQLAEEIAKQKARLNLFENKIRENESVIETHNKMSKISNKEVEEMIKSREAYRKDVIAFREQYNRENKEKQIILTESLKKDNELANLRKVQKECLVKEEIIQSQFIELSKLKGEYKKLAESKDTTLSKKLESSEATIKELEMKATIAESKYLQIFEEFSNAKSLIKTKMDMIAEKDKQLNNKETALKQAPPVLLDQSIKRDRDRALTDARQARFDLVNSLEEVTVARTKLDVGEQIIKELKSEKDIIVKSQEEIKRVYVESLNEQRTKHERDLDKKEQRIKDLEVLLINKIKN